MSFILSIDNLANCALNPFWPFQKPCLYRISPLLYVSSVSPSLQMLTTRLKHAVSPSIIFSSSDYCPLSSSFTTKLLKSGLHLLLPLPHLPFSSKYQTWERVRVLVPATRSNLHSSHIVFKNQTISSQKMARYEDPTQGRFIYRLS